MEPTTGGRSTGDGRATIDVINYYTIVVVIVAAVAIASVVGVAVLVGEFDEPEPDEDDLIEETDVSVEVESLNGRVLVTWTDEGDAEYLSIRDADGEFERIEIFGESATVDDRPFTVVAVFEDGEEARIEEYTPGV